MKGWGDGSAKLVTIRPRHLAMACAVVCALLWLLGWCAIERLEAIHQDCSAQPVSTEDENTPGFDPEPLPTSEIL